MHHRRAARSDGTSWAALGPAALTVVSLASVLCLVLGALALTIGMTRPTTRTSTAARPWTTTTTFGWSGTTTANDIYPDGQVQSPQPVFLRLLNEITVTADVSSSGVARSGSQPLTLRATLSDDSGWSRTWALDRAVVSTDGPAHLSAPLKLDTLFDEVAWNQIATGVQNPITLTLSVDREQGNSPSARLAFSLQRLLFKPLGPLTTSNGGTVSATTHTAGAVRLAGQSVSVARLRTSGAVLIGAGLIVAAAATLADQRRRRRRRAESAPHLRVAVPGQRQTIEEDAPEAIAL